MTALGIKAIQTETHEPRSRSNFDAARMTGRLVRSPFAGRVYRSNLLMGPLTRPSEYAAIAGLEHSATPVLLSPWQRDTWFVELLSAARKYMPALSLTVIRMGGRNPRVQLPRELLDDSVLLTHDPGPTTARMLTSGRSDVMEIWHDIRTDGMDRGENSIVMTVYGPRLVPGFLDFAAEASSLAAIEVSSLVPLTEA